jgi:hypothetical protein
LFRLLYALSWRLPIWGGSQNMEYIKRTEEYIPLYSSITRNR